MATPDLLQRKLAQGLKTLDLDVSESAQAAAIAYLDLIKKWNAVYNLTAVADPAQGITLHLLDSLALLPWLQGPRILDVGSGAGLPGIPLALARPDLQFVLLDRTEKKVRFMTQAVIELGLKNVEVVHARVEDYHPSAAFNTVMSRAFAQLHDMLRLSAHLCVKNGQFLCQKGARPDQELLKLPPQYDAKEVITLSIPGLDARRCLVRLVAKPDNG